MIANGWTLSFVDSGSVSNLKSFQCEFAKRGDVDSTTLIEEYYNLSEPISICDPGTISGEAFFKLGYLPPINGVKETIRLKHELLMIDADGYLNGFNIAGPVNGFLKCNIEIKLSGPITFYPREPLDNVEGVDLRNTDGQYIYGTD